jgi:hypothetical protein
MVLGRWPKWASLSENVESTVDPLSRLSVSVQRPLVRGKHVLQHMCNRHLIDHAATHYRQ